MLNGGLFFTPDELTNVHRVRCFDRAVYGVRYLWEPKYRVARCAFFPFLVGRGAGSGLVLCELLNQEHPWIFWSSQRSDEHLGPQIP